MSTNLASLSPENEQFVQDALDRGAFVSRSELVNTAVGLLRQREQLRRDVNAGIDQLERGDGELLDIADIKARGRQRLAAQQAPDTCRE